MRLTGITQDMFLYGVIVPVIPFALEQNSHVEHDRGTFSLFFSFELLAY